MSGEDHNQAVAHAAIGLVSKPDKEKKRGGRSGGGGEEWCWMYTWRPRRRKGEEGEKEKEERGSRMEKQGASHLCLPVLQPCHHAMLLREEWRGCWLLCASMSMSMRGNVMHGISCHHHHDELFVCQCVLQPAIPVCMCVCVCAEGTPVQAAGRRRSTPKKEERTCVCVRRKRGKQPAK